ncbi:MAG TPA: AraC family transcriptional regulator ligand-binding domain-containing protein [Polyangiaceae bacterium]|jgi:AraC-like DNA-binding protein|nr:AraC family transcriptional regulator ligand-binding domain-containing protein [Polyangiaceae bacterium]
MATPCYSARFIRPFAALLATSERFDRKSLEKLRSIDAEGRLPIETAHRLVEDQIEQTGDQNLGIRAARLTALGSGGALDYAMNSAATVRDALEVGARYTRLFSDSLRVSFDVQGARALVRLGTTIPAPRAVPDFAMAVWFINHTRLPLGESPKLECFFEHEVSGNTDEYDRTYEDAELTFGAPFYGISFGREYLDAPLATADPRLHLLLCEHVASMAARLDERVLLTNQVRELVMKQLFDGAPSLAHAAKQLRMSARTLAMKLEREGTTFSALVDDLRRDLALRYLNHREISHSEIAFRLGFAHVEGFYRAFKRWTGLTPLSYRRAENRIPTPYPRFPDSMKRH